MKLFIPGIIIVLIIFLVTNILKTKSKEGFINFFNTSIVQGSPSPTPYQFPYKKPEIVKNDSYRIIIVGDSMVASLGPNANRLREHLIALYPDNEFVTYNYGYAANNISTLPDRFTKVTTNQGSDLPPILGEEFELLIIESFGYNPLSQYSLPEGLNKQNEILENVVRQFLAKKPNVYLAFMTPIALDPVNFAKNTYDLSNETRKKWVDERVAYINNHKKFALDHGIPVIDIFERSKKSDGLVNKKLIGEDFIHPSADGVEFMSKEIADFIFSNQVFPK